jgi:hypothetical protein
VKKLPGTTSSKKKKEKYATFKRNNPSSKCMFLFLSFRQGRIDMKRSPPQEKIIMKKVEASGKDFDDDKKYLVE